TATPGPPPPPPAAARPATPTVPAPGRGRHGHRSSPPDRPDRQARHASAAGARRARAAAGPYRSAVVPPAPAPLQPAARRCATGDRSTLTDQRDPGGGRSPLPRARPSAAGARIVGRPAGPEVHCGAGTARSRGDGYGRGPG